MRDKGEGRDRGRILYHGQAPLIIIMAPFSHPRGLHAAFARPIGFFFNLFFFSKIKERQYLHAKYRPIFCFPASLLLPQVFPGEQKSKHIRRAQLHLHSALSLSEWKDPLTF